MSNSTDQGNDVHDTGQQAQSRRLASSLLAEGRVVWLIAVLLPVLALGMLLLAGWSRAKDRQSTGDPLYDKCIAAVIRSTVSSPSCLDIRMQGVVPFSMDDATLQSWEDEFGSDPRFWMLRYHFTDPVPKALEEEFEPRRLSASTYYLEEARRRGIADGPVIYNLLKHYNSAWWSEDYDRTDFSELPDIRQKRIARVREIQAIIDQRHGEELEALLGELAAAAGDDAMAHYYIAMIRARQGRYGEAVASLRRGNRTDKHTMLLGFPFDRLLMDIRDGRPLEDKIASGKLCESYNWVGLPDFIHLKDMVSALSLEAAARGDLSWLDELHTYACRFAIADGAIIIHGLVALVQLQMIRKEALSNWPQPLDADQKKALNELDAQLGKLKLQYTTTGQSTSPWYSFNQSPSPLYLLTMAESQLAGGQTFALLQCEYMHEATCQQQQNLDASIKPLVEQIMQFDYNTLSWEEP